MTPVTHSKPWIIDADLEAVRRVLESRMIGQGERTAEFEATLAEWVGADGAVAVGSGSAALALALTALGVRAGDEVVIPTYVCASVGEAVATVGADAVLCDVGPAWVVTPEAAARVVTRKTRALIVPHMYGIYADVDSFRRFGLPIVEDCAQAVDYKGKRPLTGDIGVFSFHPTKCLTVGEGGAAVAHDPALVRALRTRRDGASAGDRGRLLSPLSDVAAALGLSQLARYHEALDRRRALALRYRAALEPIVREGFVRESFDNGMLFRLPLKVPGGLPVYQEAFARRNIHVRRGVARLLHRVRGRPDAGFETSVDHFETTLSLPLYPALTDDEHAACVRAALEILSRSESRCR